MSHVTIVAARFNESIVRGLHEGAFGALRRHDWAASAIETVWVPGAFELPLAAQQAIRQGGAQGVIALGCIIRGGTAHFDYVCQGAAQGITRVALDTGVPVAFGVLTVDDWAQAAARAGLAASSEPKAGKECVSNKGEEAAEALVAMMALPKRWEN